MQELRQWAFGICAAAIACGMVQLLAPKSGMRRVLEITISVFFLSCLLSPFALSFSATLDMSGKEALEQEIAQRADRLRNSMQQRENSMASESIRIEARRVLDELGVEGGKIYVTIHENGTDSISISECELELASRYLSRHEEIRATLQKRLGVTVYIGYSGDADDKKE